MSSYRPSKNNWKTPENHKFRIKTIRFFTTPNFDGWAEGGGCDPYFHIKILNEEGKMIKIFDWSKVNTVKHFKLKTTQITLDCTKHPPPILEGDIKFVFYDYDKLSSDDKMFHLWVNTAYIEHTYLRFSKPVIDKACKDKSSQYFDDIFEIEFILELDTSEEDVKYQDLGGYDKDIDVNTDEEEGPDQ